MAIPSRVLGSGVNSLSTVSICGDGNASVTAAGTSAGSATQLTFVYNNVTTVGAGAGVKLPPTEMGELIWITNSGANALTVYPYEATSTINATTSATINKGCAAAVVHIWLRKNGTNVPNTTSRVVIQGTAAELVAAWNFIIQLEPTNYVELMWESDDADVVLLAASATSVYPAIPSVICTVTQVNNL